MTRCPSCGQENPDGFRFCGACGAGLAPPPPAREVPVEVAPFLAPDAARAALQRALAGASAKGNVVTAEQARAQLEALP